MAFRRQLSPEMRDAYKKEVVASLEKTGLDRDTTLVLGGGAMALAGIRPAGDIDLMVPHFVFTDLNTYRRTPSGLILQNKYGAKHPFLETTPVHLPPDTMNVDITHPHDAIHHAGSPELDDEFIATLDNFDAVDGYHFLPPELVAAHKNRPDRPNSRKDRKDLRLIRDFLKERE
jgi:hypothetical protein